MLERREDGSMQVFIRGERDQTFDEARKSFLFTHTLGALRKLYLLFFLANFNRLEARTTNGVGLGLRQPTSMKCAKVIVTILIIQVL